MNESHDNLLTQALESVPQAPLPPGFVNRVMTRIEPAPLPPRFRLQFVDLAVPAFASLLLVTLILLAAQTDWLPLLLGGETVVSPLTSFQLTPTLTAVIMAVVGELALLVIFCWGLWGDSPAWLE